jgi:hypothetical protein
MYSNDIVLKPGHLSLQLVSKPSDETQTFICFASDFANLKLEYYYLYDNYTKLNSTNPYPNQYSFKNSLQ